MGLYDVIDDISNRQIMKTATGDNRIFGVMIGIVVKNFEKDRPGCICVSIPVRDANANMVKWAKMITNSGGSKWGTYFLPEVGDQVVLAFEEGSIEKPYVVGCLAKNKADVVSKASDENNQFKKIVTKNGSHITFMDNKEGEGEKDQVVIQTAKELHTISMDNEGKVITITDKEKKNQIVLNTGEGALSIKVEKKIAIKVGDSITLSMNGETGAVNLKCDKITVEASKSANTKCDGNMKVTGSSIAVEASNSLKLESSGTSQFKGATVQLG